jgi:8-oxo-dGTP pyrophosphatase MutT (NUDIX family)
MIHHTIKHPDVFPDEQITEPASYTTRNTAKGIILDAHRKIALVSKKGSGYYFLPGGGVEEGETPEQALMRECGEEMGHSIKIDKKFATTSEYRAKSGELYQASCFMARLAEDGEEVEIIPEDSSYGMETLWITRAEAIELFKKQLKKITDKTDNYYNRKFNTIRDLFFIEKSLI